jgi:hypothetical protein
VASHAGLSVRDPSSRDASHRAVSFPPELFFGPLDTVGGILAQVVEQRYARTCCVGPYGAKPRTLESVGNLMDGTLYRGTRGKHMRRFWSEAAHALSPQGPGPESQWVGAPSTGHGGFWRSSEPSLFRLSPNPKINQAAKAAASLS